jgi:tetratricopeptide (TPR) repeat protein
MSADKSKKAANKSQNEASKKGPAPVAAKDKSPGPAFPAGPKPPLFRRVDWITFWVTTLLTFIGYYLTLAPNLTLEDSGELAVGSQYASVPHPPGYPVWTIYTWLFTVLVPVSNIAWRVALSSAVAGAFACGMIGLITSRSCSLMVEGIEAFKELEKRWESSLCFVSGFVASMLLGFNGFMWSQAVIVEVYTFSVLSLMAVLVCLMCWMYAPERYRYLLWAFFWFGICFTNHQTLICAAMGIEIAIVARHPKLGRDFLFLNSVLFLAGLFLMAGGGVVSIRNNPMLFKIYLTIGISSIIGWAWLLIEHPKTAIELARDGCLAMFLLLPTISAGGSFRFIIALGFLAAFIKLAWDTRKQAFEMSGAVFCGLLWSLGAAFYLYMPLTSMSNPPMNWGYPRTVEGFFHALSRGQYEQTKPTQELHRFIEQVGMLKDGAIEEFNLVYLLIAIVPFLFLSRMDKRDRAWMIGLTATYCCLAFLLLILLSPSPDRQSRDLTKVFFTASHVMIAIWIGYGVTLIGALLLTQYERFRIWFVWIGSVAAGYALYELLVVTSSDTAVPHGATSGSPLINAVFTFMSLPIEPSANSLNHFSSWFGLFVAGAFTFSLVVMRARPVMPVFLALFAVIPTQSIVSHWSRNEQRGHLFGYWFGHDMFTPPFNDVDGKPIYPEMTRDTVLFGGTDPGRFCPTYMIFSESFIPPSKKADTDPKFDRRDVYIITQNALADATYLMYIRAHFNRSKQIDPPFFQELLRSKSEKEKNLSTNLVARIARKVLDGPFLALGDRIEKRRRVGPSYFEPDHFTDVKSLAAKLRTGPQQDKLSQHISENLSPKTQQLLQGSDENALRTALCADLDVLLDKGLLYDEQRFAGINLTDRTRRFIKQDPKSHTRVRLNRLLLEEAYSKEISKSEGGVYPDLEIHTPGPLDSQKAFEDYVKDAQERMQKGQLKPGEDVKIIDNRIQVSGQVAVMAINGLLTKNIFDENPNHDFYVEESFPLDWMYPYLTPAGIIMKINRQQLPELTEEIVRKDHLFWSKYSERFIGNWITYDTPVSNICAFAEKVYLRRDYSEFKGDPKFVRDDDAQKAFSKLRGAIGGVYMWRINAHANNRAVQQRMIREADFAYRQAFAFCPYSPEAVFRYTNLLISMGRLEDAYLVAQTFYKLDPYNPNGQGLVNQLTDMRAKMGGAVPAQPVPQGATQGAITPDAAAVIAQAEAQYQANPNNGQLAFNLFNIYLQIKQTNKGVEVMDKILANPQADASALAMVAQASATIGNFTKMEQAVSRLVLLQPNNPEAWYDLATIRAALGKNREALQALSSAIPLSNARLKQQTNAMDLRALATGDTRFNALKSFPEFQQAVAPPQ